MFLHSLLQFVEASVASYGTAPPSYDDVVADAPPDYSSTESLATANSLVDYLAPFETKGHTKDSSRASGSTDPMVSPSVNLNDTSGFKTTANKKAKQAKKKQQQASWADSGDEGEKKNEGGDEEGGSAGGADGGGDGGGGNGDGGDGGGGGDEGGGDDWNFGGGGKKNKKKNKKNKWLDEEDDEEKKKKEEEEAAAAADNANALSWADEGTDAAKTAAPDDEWGFSEPAGKKGKKKKGKVSAIIFLMQKRS